MESLKLDVQSLDILVFWLLLVGNFCGLDKLYLAKLELWRCLDDPEDAKLRTQLRFACIGRIEKRRCVWLMEFHLYTCSFSNLSERKPSCTGWFLHAGLFLDYQSLTKVAWGFESSQVPFVSLACVSSSSSSSSSFSSLFLFLFLFFSFFYFFFFSFFYFFFFF